MQAQKIIEKSSVVVQTRRMDKSPEEKPVSVRMPAALKDELAKVAAKEKRSMNQTFLFIIERGLAAYKRDGKVFEPEGTATNAEHPTTLSVPTITLDSKGTGKKKRA